MGHLQRTDFSKDLLTRGLEIASRLRGGVPSGSEIQEDDFLNREFKGVVIDALGLDAVITGVLKQRIEEVKKCLNAKASLAVIFLCGSALEGILLGVATQNVIQFNQAALSPKDKNGNVRRLYDWTLNDLINVARELGLLGEDVKKFSHVLRDFRNYIHPYQQISSGFDPDQHTARICWQVLQAAIVQLSK